MNSPAGNLFAKPSVSMTKQKDGSRIIRSNLKAKTPPENLCDWLRKWAINDPERMFLGERASEDNPWKKVTYGEALQKARAAGSWMIEHRLSEQRPAVVLSDNSIDHALIALGAMFCGIPVSAISPAYSLMSTDHAKLKSMIELLQPGLIYVTDAEQYRKALDAIAESHDAKIAVGANAARNHLAIEELYGAEDANAVDQAFETVTGDTIAKFLFTSGSTGIPKAVINTHRMLASNQEAKAVIWPFIESEPPVIVDWLPWSHTFGANHNFNLVMRNGGTLYIDAGRPAPPLFPKTIANLKDVAPNIYFNVPRGYAMLVDALKQDEVLRERFFNNVRVIFYAAAALPQNLWDDLNQLSVATTGSETPMVSAWGSTETSPLATDCHFQAKRSGNIGVPAPGVELKLVPIDGKQEVRVRGPNVMPGYWKNDEATRNAFDKEGFYCIGDAVKLVDEEDASKGIYFDGRVVEDFKLSSGTFVNVGELRVQGIAALAPIAQDIVVCGHDTAEVGFLIFPDLAACRRIANLGGNETIDEVLKNGDVRASIAAGLQKLRDACGGASSRHATRARLLRTPASVDAGEITDKGYINQRAVLESRSNDVAKLMSSDKSKYIALPERL